MEYKINYKQELNPEQYEAVTSIDGPLLIIAGAGSGKTSTLTYRVSYLIENGIAPESILLLTFTNAAAEEMQKRAATILDDRCSRITACTYHSFCAAMLRKYGKIINLKSNFTIITPSEVNDAISFTKAKRSEYKIKGFPNKAVCAAIFSDCVNKNCTISEIIKTEKYEKYSLYVNELDMLRQEYNLYKRSKNIVDYDDLLVLFERVLQDEQVLKHISDSYKYIMVDEYQDTNNIQERILFTLRKLNNNLAVVGDDYQSIYAFRGSNIDNILNFPDKMPSCKQVILNTNYRSSQEILDLANEVMKRHANFGFKKNMKSTGKHGQKPTLVQPNDQYEEAQYVLKEIDRLHKSGLPFSEIAVIERNSYSSFILENMLNGIGIPYNKRGGLKFLEHECVLNMLAYLKCVINPYDEIAWFRILQLHPGIGDTYARNLSQLSTIDKDFLINNNYCKKKFYNELVLLHNEINKVRNIIDFNKQYEELKQFFYNLQERVIQQMKVECEDNRAIYFHQLKSDMNTLAVLQDMAAPYDNISKFLDAIILDSLPKSSEEEDSLCITTIHSAKGLEFKAVFVLDCVDGIFPSITPELMGTFEDNEELRCFYVSITRAKDYLYVLCPVNVTRYGQYIPGIVTHYLDGCMNYLNFLSV